MSQAPTLEFYSQIHTGTTDDGREVKYAELHLTKDDAQALSTVAGIASSALQAQGKDVEAFAAGQVALHFLNVFAALNTAGSK